jgi:hypothetical protein
MNKGELVSVSRLLEPIAIPEGAWEVICMDFIGGLPKSEGKDVILVILDKLTKYYHLIALSHPYTASSVDERFLDIVYKLHGLPIKIITDKDPLFTSTF